MSTNNNNDDSKSSKEYLELINRDTDEFGNATAQEIRNEVSEQSAEGTESNTDDSWFELASDVKEFLLAEASNTSSGFGALLDAVIRDPTVFSMETAPNEESVQPDLEDPIPDESCMELNADKEELPISDDDVKDKDAMDSCDLPAKKTSAE